jgi:hypothetical protein
MPSVFSVLGVPPASGRTLAAADSRGERVVVISHGLAQRVFAGRSPVGERLTLDREPYTILGVMPASFEFPKRGPQLNGEPADAWTPLIFNPFERQARGMFYNHTVIGRLGDGTTVQQAAAEMTTLGPQIRERYPGVGLYGVLAFGVTQRTREIGVRLALGATHAEVLGLVVRRGMKLTPMGLLIGLAGAVAASRFLGSFLYETAALDLRTFSVVPLVLAAVALIACYVPARRAARINPIAALRSE